MFPKSTLFHYPILLLLSDGKEYTSKDCRAFIVSKLLITSEQVKEMTPGGPKAKPRNMLESWTNRALTDLKKALFIEHTGIGYRITKDGMEFFNSHKSGFEAKDLKVSAAYRKYKGIAEKESKDASKKVKNKKSSKKSTKNDGIGYVYILTNPVFKSYYIKIGYTTNLNDRLKELFNTSVPMSFKVFAVLKTTKYKLAEKMIHAAFQNERIDAVREFFYLRPEEALKQMIVVAEGIDGVVVVYDGDGDEKKTYDYSKPK